MNGQQDEVSHSRLRRSRRSHRCRFRLRITAVCWRLVASIPVILRRSVSAAARKQLPVLALPQLQDHCVPRPLCRYLHSQRVETKMIGGRENCSAAAEGVADFLGAL